MIRKENTGLNIKTDLSAAILVGRSTRMGRDKALLVFNRNQAGNAFWESQGFSRREDVAYRNRELAKLRRIDT